MPEMAGRLALASQMETLSVHHKQLEGNAPMPFRRPRVTRPAWENAAEYSRRHTGPCRFLFQSDRGPPFPAEVMAFLARSGFGAAGRSMGLHP